MGLITIAFSTLARLLVDSLFGLSLGKEADIVVKVWHLRDGLRRSSSMLKMAGDEMMITVNGAVPKSLCKHLA